MRLAFITGATSGIGRATARLFADNNINLILCGRRQGRLDSLKIELSNQVSVHTLTFDVRDRDNVIAAVGSLPENFKVCTET